MSGAFVLSRFPLEGYFEGLMLEGYVFHPSHFVDGPEGRILEVTTVISIVDDDEDVRLGLGSLVRSLGWEARMFGSAEEFLASGEAAATSCLISDIRMSGMSGLKMHERLVAQGHSPATIFISAYPTPALHERAASSGALVLLGIPSRAVVIAHWLSIAVGSPSEVSASQAGL